MEFWAPWCRPCHVLGPVLEKLHAEAGGRWALVKVNTDEEPGLMQRYGIRGIPAVKLFVDGAVAAEFTGALPEHILRQWLAEHLPSPGQAHTLAGDAAWARGDRETAREEWEAALAEPEAATAAWTADARSGLARALAFDDPGRARQLAEGLYSNEAAAVRFVLAACDRDVSALPDGPARQLVVDAHGALRTGDLDAALGHLVEAIHTDRYYDNDGARKLAIALFHTLGERDPVVRKHRPGFSMSLY